MKLVIDATVPGEGAIELLVLGGSEPFEFVWTSEGQFVSDAPNPINLAAPAEYNVVVTDANGCEIQGGPYELMMSPRCRTHATRCT